MVTDPLMISSITLYKRKKKEKRSGEGVPMRGLGMDLSANERLRKKTASDGANRQTNRQTDMVTL